MSPPDPDFADVPAAADVPPGLPDAATLARLATEFLRALPGANASGGNPVPAQPPFQPAGLSTPPGVYGPSSPAAVPGGPLPGANVAPSTPQSAANFGASAPARVPHADAPHGVPDLLFTAAPGYDGRLGSHALGVPAFLPPSLPIASPPAPLNVPAGSLASSSSTPSFYFLDEPRGPGARDPHAPTAFAPARPPFDVHAVRRDFPLLQERVNGRRIAWFDNAATTQKPQAVIDRLASFYAHENSNVHRGAHEMAARATDAYENAREIVRRFIGARSAEEIVWVRGSTEAINLVAKSWGAKHVGAADEIVVSHLEHHANIVPWQQLATEKGAVLRVIPVDDDGQVRLDELRRLLGPRTRIVAVTQVSNALGTVVPAKEIVDLAHAAGALALVDAAQSVAHLRTDVRALDADFLVFSGHKVFGPTGIGVLYGKREVLEDMPPWQGGGNMISDVTFERTQYHAPPTRFEAGTGNIADAVGLGAALEYVERLGIEAIGAYEHGLLDYATSLLAPIPGVRLVGTAREKASVLSFVMAGRTTDEVGRALNAEGIAVRTGHHCAQPILRRFGIEATVRPSLAFYNTCEEVDRFIAVVRQLASARR